MMYYIGMDTVTAYNGDGLNRAETALRGGADLGVCGAGSGIEGECKISVKSLQNAGGWHDICSLSLSLSLSHIFIGCNSL